MVRLEHTEEDCEVMLYAPFEGLIHPQVFPLGTPMKGFNCGPKLKHLDIRLLEGHYSEEWQLLRSSTKLPQQLTYLRLPSNAVLPPQLCRMVEALPLLSHLDCRGTHFYPTGLTNLQSLCVGRQQSKHLQEFCETSLSGFSNLSSLQLQLFSTSGSQSARPVNLVPGATFPRLLELRVAGCMDPANLAALLLPFAHLQVLELNVDSVALSTLEDTCFLRPFRDSLRSLAVKQLPGGLGVLLSLLRRPDLTSLAYFPLSDHHLSELPNPYFLDPQDVLSISSLTSLTRLELPQGWLRWGDLTPLHRLPLVELACSNLGMLYDLITPPRPPPAFRGLQAVSLGAMMSDLGDDWLRGKGVLRGQVVAKVARALLRLPRLESLMGRGNRFEKKVEGVLEREVDALIITVRNIVRVCPKQWSAGERRRGSIVYRRLG